jgi:hypothetical protein
VFIAVLVLGSVQGLEILRFSGLAALLSSFVEFAGKVLLGLVILAVGFYIADWAERLVRAGRARQKDFLGTLARVSVWVLAGIMALDQMEMANTTINIAFGIILGGLALAAALAFGLGGQNLAQGLLKRWEAELNTTPDPKAGKKVKRRA